MQGAARDMSFLVGGDGEVFPFEGEKFAKPCAGDIFGEQQPAPEVEWRFGVFHNPALHLRECDLAITYGSLCGKYLEAAGC